MARRLHHFIVRPAAVVHELYLEALRRGPQITLIQKDAPTAWVGTPPSSPRPGHLSAGLGGLMAWFRGGG